MKTLRAEPLTAEDFAPFGQVIEASAGRREAMNAARFERFNQLCQVETPDNGEVAVGIVRCRVATRLPYRVDMLERHPCGSQAFVPLQSCRMVVVVAPPVADIDNESIRAFVSNGRQGINYRIGTWHMPLISTEAGHEFLVIDRAVDGPNCDEHYLADPFMLEIG